MAPRRGNHGQGQGQGAGNGVFIGNFVEIPGYNLAPEGEHQEAGLGVGMRCACPTECLRESSVSGLEGDASISVENLRDAVKVVCNNEQCTVGKYMHRECFDSWEQAVLTYLKSCGRARSWSERQRHQNLWTKKGYDLAFKACGCKCGRGHLKKDLDWTPPQGNNQRRLEENADNKKKKRNKNKNLRPSLAISTHPGGSPNNNGKDPGVTTSDVSRGRTGSLSSSNGSASPPVSSETSVSPAHSGSSTGSNGMLKKKTSKIDFFSDRVRNGSAGNGIFSRRQDFSSFNLLPKHKLNSYHIKNLTCFRGGKQMSVSETGSSPGETGRNCVREARTTPASQEQMEDEGNHGNDDTRCFILSTLAAMHMSRVACVLCDSPMLVFDRYPLVDGTFFLSPRQHSKSCLEVRIENRTQYLSAVCMTCLEGWGAGRRLRCLYCATSWDGSSLVIGTMYSYDIFAAMPCCTERLRCNNCQKPLLQPHQRLNYYSDYSHTLACPHCQASDTHFVKPLGFCYTKDIISLWP